MSILILEEVARQTYEDAREAGIHDEADGFSSVSWMVPELLRLVAEHRETPVYRLREVIRQLILDRAYGAADGCNEAHLDAAVEREVQLLVDALERTRREALRRGHWSVMMPEQEMFG